MHARKAKLPFILLEHVYGIDNMNTMCCSARVCSHMYRSSVLLLETRMYCMYIYHTPKKTNEPRASFELIF
jgi:hypothetical protein